MAEWLYEDGIGERRAALVTDGRIIAAEVERDGDGPPVGSIVSARLLVHDRPRRRARIMLADGGEAWLLAAPAALTEGARIMVRITRMALREAGRIKPAHAQVAEGEVASTGPDLLARITASQHPVVRVNPIADPDRLETAGWSELRDSAITGLWPFAGGGLDIALTPAMTVIDIDGDLPLLELAEAGAHAAIAAIGTLNITGSIGIDFPGLASRTARQRIDAILEAGLPAPFERTAMNGFGFVQIIRRRERASLAEKLRLEPVVGDALALLRLGERARGSGALCLTARAAVIDCLAAHPAWLAELGRRTGRPVTLATDGQLQGAGYAQ